MVVCIIVYRHLLNRWTDSLVAEQQKRVVFTEDEELQSMLLADDLHLSTRIPCGKEKCFFVSSTGRKQGYLIARTSRTSDGSEKFTRLVDGWDLATRLQQEYGIKHFLVSSPEIVPVSDHLAALLNRNLWFETQDLPVNQVGKKKKKLDRFPQFSQAYVQKVQVAPTPNLLLACAHSNRPHFERHIHQFLLNVHPKKFMTTFSKNLEKTRKLLVKEPCLMKDFQVLMDPEGEIYHLDFDRCFQTREVDETQECFDYLDEVESRIQETLQDPFQANNIATRNRVVCGKEKCLFKVKSSKAVAYIVAQPLRESDNTTTTTIPTRKRDGFASIRAGYNLGQNLTQQYGSMHFYVSPPMNLTVDKSLTKQLNQNLWSEERQYRLRDSTSFNEGGAIYVQKIHLAPEPNLLLGTRSSQLDLLKRTLPKFLSTVQTSSFLKRFQSNIKQQKLLIQSEPCLANDFQALVDTRGNFFQLDLDRCFVPGTSVKQNITNEELSECLQAIDSIEKQVKKAISRHKTR
jgi:hypothetical protein